MTVPRALLIFALCWTVLAVLGRFVLVPFLNRGPGDDPALRAIWRLVRIYCHVWHRATYSGTENLPQSDDEHDGLIVVANHTGAVDPLLIQASCRFLVRWMMASDMMGGGLGWLWRHQPIIAVDRDGNDSGPLREAIRQVRAGHAVGIFPEGRITMPPGELRPFLAGVGVLVSRAKAPVLLAWISGTPPTNKLGEALTTRSHARVVYIEMMSFEGERDHTVIAETLRRRIAEVSGWPLNNETLPPGGVESNAA